MGILSTVTKAFGKSSILGNIATSAFDAMLGSFGSSQQNDYNKEMAQYQNDYNTKMWHMQNEYNSPKATMQRLVDAGINPRAYQQIGQFANAGEPQPSVGANKISEISAFQGVARQALENKLLNEQVLSMRQERKKMHYQTNVEEQKFFDMQLKHFITSLEHGVDPHTFVHQWANMFDEFGGETFLSQTDAYKDFTREEGLYHLKKLGIKNKNDAEIALKNLRDIENAMKNKELQQYQDYGITKNSGDIYRLVFNIVDLIRKCF